MTMKRTHVCAEQMEILKTKGEREQLLKWEDVQQMKYSVERGASAGCVQGGDETDFSFNGFSIPKGWKL